MAIASLQGLTLEYIWPEPITLFRNFDLECEPGRVTSLFGPNGSGKSALVKQLVSYPEPGRIARFAKASLPSRRGYAPQDSRASLMGWLDGRDNIFLPHVLGGRTHRKSQHIVTDAAAHLGIDLPLNLKPHAMSGGQAQLIVLAREIGRAPALLVLDEALSGVFYHVRLRLIEQLRTWVTDTKSHILSISHDATETALFSDEVVLLGGPPHFQTERVVVDRGLTTETGAELPSWSLAAAQQLRVKTHALAAVAEVAL